MANNASPHNASPHNADQPLFIEEVQGHQARYTKVIELTHSATKAAGVMLLAAIAALAIANSGIYGQFEHLIHTQIGFVVGDSISTMSIAHIINDILMAVFFLLVGLEIKYEMTVGELTNIRQAILPIVAACGGVLAPIAIYAVFNFQSPETLGGWGVPTATDIAFALGIMALLGNRIPVGVKVFLSTLAVADDIIAIIVIAVFYGHTPDFMWLAAAVVVMLALVALNKSHVYSLAPYLALGVVLWFCVFSSGVHSTIAGVLLAFTIPSGSRVNLKGFVAWSDKKIRQAENAFDPNEPVLGQKDYIRNVSNLSSVSRLVIPPATRLEHKLYPWVYFVILPLFALTNADVALAGADMGAIFTSPVFFGVFFGLLIGKPVGILLFSFVVVKLKIASLPENVNWRHMAGAAVLGGVGFTMAIFVANLAYDSELAVTTAKAAVLLASTVAGVVGFLLLLTEARRSASAGVAFVALPADGENVTHDGAEARRGARAMRDSFDEASLAEIDRCKNDGCTHEVVARLRDARAAQIGREQYGRK